MADSST